MRERRPAEFGGEELVATAAWHKESRGVVRGHAAGAGGSMTNRNALSSVVLYSTWKAAPGNLMSLLVSLGVGYGISARSITISHSYDNKFRSSFLKSTSKYRHNQRLSEYGLEMTANQEGL